MKDDLEIYTYPNRTVCSVLADMRKAYEVRNFSSLLAMIEEVQYLANRMESAIADISDIREWTVRRSKLKAEIRELVRQKKELLITPGGTENETE